VSNTTIGGWVSETLQAESESDGEDQNVTKLQSYKATKLQAESKSDGEDEKTSLVYRH